MRENIVFIGPTLSLEEAKKILPSALYLPPAKRGDFIKAIQYDPKKILLIDGYFETQASIQHKEILLAIEQGIGVYGTASMGAIRAAELSNFGMKGIGRIFNFYLLENADEDEVAVIHDKKGFSPINDAMINIRFTLKRAVDEKILNLSDADFLIQTAKETFYKNRNLSEILYNAKNKIHESTLNLLLDWVKNGGYVNQKYLDAIEGLKLFNTEKTLPKKSITHINVERTAIFEKLIRDTICSTTILNTPIDNIHNQGIEKYAKKLAFLLECHSTALNGKIEDYYSFAPDPKIKPLLIALDGAKNDRDFKDKYYNLASFISSKLMKKLKQRSIFPSSDTQQIFLKKLMQTKKINSESALKKWLVTHHIDNQLDNLIILFFYLTVVVESRNFSLLNDSLIKIPITSWYEIAIKMLI